MMSGVQNINSKLYMVFAKITKAAIYTNGHFFNVHAAKECKMLKYSI